MMVEAEELGITSIEVDVTRLSPSEKVDVIGLFIELNWFRLAHHNQYSLCFLFVFHKDLVQGSVGILE